ELSTAGLPIDVPITFAGHSLGGCVGTILAARERQLRPKRPMRCVTFGEPKTGDTRLRTIVEASHERIESYDDLVCIIPPDVGIFGWMSGLVAPSFLEAWQRFDFSSTGRRVMADGSFIVADRGRGVFGDLLDIVMDFVNHDPIEIPDLHYLNQYS